MKDNYATDSNELIYLLITCSIKFALGQANAFDTLGTKLKKNAVEQVRWVAEETLVDAGKADLATTERILARREKRASRLNPDWPPARYAAEANRVFEDLTRRGIKFVLKEGR